MSALAMAPLFAVHISDGILRPEWEWGGLALAALLALYGAWGIREEEIPRVSLLAAAFFVSSQIHVPIPGGTTAHLLLNGLLGVVLGRRALLAVPVGLLMQKVLFNHGGYFSLGVNACVMGLPALASSVLFERLRRLSILRRTWFGSLVVAVSTVSFGLTLVYSVTLLITNAPLNELKEVELSTANRITFHPVTLFAVLVLAAVAVGIERRLQNPPDFYLGLVIGESAVLLTILLNALALIFGVLPDKQSVAFSLALLTFILHLPLAVIEGIILGFTVGFLARVKPEMLGRPAVEKRMSRRCFALTLLLLLLIAGSARAHALKADYTILPGKQVRIECWFERGGPPKAAMVRVERSDGAVLVEGKADSKGEFVFTCEEPQALKAIVDAGDGHRVELSIPADKLANEGAFGSADPQPETDQNRTHRHDEPFPWGTVLLGVGVLLVPAALVLGLRIWRQREKVGAGE